MHSPLDNSPASFEVLIEQARGGCAKAAGMLFDQCRGYLLAIANQRLDEQLQAKMGGSDLVQNTLMHAHRDFAHFRGRSEAELLAWLRRILLNEAARANREFLETAKRDVSREVAFGRQDGSRGRGSWLPADVDTPSRQAAAEEEDARLEQALERLSAPHRRVIELRNRDLHTFAEIGARMDISEERARRLWARAIERLRRDLPVEGED
jgi:RNA polymerase sigma-70 factor (ECF subfamily)